MTVSLHYRTGNLLDSPCQVLVNAVNCVGVAGAGLAKQFQDRWPEQVAEYREFCRAGKMRPGVVHEASLPEGRSILSVPTKRHWRNPSAFQDVALGIRAMARWCREGEITSIAVPALGCGLGGLPRNLVRGAIEMEMSDLRCQVHLYGFGAPTS